MAQTVGEDAARTGEDGAKRAKRWLEATMRVAMAWTNADTVHVSRLSFDWPHGGRTFSFDLGGILSGEEFEGNFFLAESKKYAGAEDQGTHFDDWVAKCYVTLLNNERLADHFLWITWAPFRIGKWKELCSVESVKQGLLVEKNRRRVFDTEDRAAAEAMIDSELAQRTADALWIIVLSDKQEKLVISAEHRSWIKERQAAEEWK